LIVISGPSGVGKDMTQDRNIFNLLNPEPLLIVISGPSGVGKDSVVIEMKDRGLPFHFVVTATTRPRPQREGEVHSVDYYFTSKSEFADMIERDELLEYAFVYNDYKGIPKSQVITKASPSPRLARRWEAGRMSSCVWMSRGRLPSENYVLRRC